MKNIDHIWALVACFVCVIVGFVILVMGNHADAGVDLRAVLLTLGAAIAGYAGGRRIDKSD